MPRITFIKKDKTKYIIKISNNDDLFEFKISEDLLVESKFITLKEISNEEFNLFLSKLPKDSLILEGYKYLDKKMKSRKEVFNHFRELTSSTKLINEVLDSLENKNLINDQEYSKALFYYLKDNKLYGPIKIVEEFKMRGLDDCYFEYLEEDIKNNIRTLLIKFNRTNSSQSREIKINKAKIFLASKGYSIENINNYFVFSLITCEKENENLKKDFERLKNKDDNLNSIKAKLLRKGYSLNKIEELIK